MSTQLLNKYDILLHASYSMLYFNNQKSMRKCRWFSKVKGENEIRDEPRVSRSLFVLLSLVDDLRSPLAFSGSTLTLSKMRAVEYATFRVFSFYLSPS